MADSDFEFFNDVIKRKIDDLRLDVAKLKAVDSLIGEDKTESKKHDLINTMFALQDVQSTVMDERFNRQNSEAMKRMMSES